MCKTFICVEIRIIFIFKSINIIVSKSYEAINLNRLVASLDINEEFYKGEIF